VDVRKVVGRFVESTRRRASMRPCCIGWSMDVRSVVVCAKARRAAALLDSVSGFLTPSSLGFKVKCKRHVYSVGVNFW
jgi:hypothetical protein